MSNETDVSLNYTSRNRGTLTFPDLGSLTLTLTKFPIPGVQLPPVEVPSPFYQKKLYGDKLLFETFNVEFRVDENLTNWISLYKWMRGLGAPETKDEFSERELTEIDAELTVYNSHNNEIAKFKFIEVVPTYLSSIDFDEAITQTEPIFCTLQMEYLRYDIV